jgi:hypothetical protein
MGVAVTHKQDWKAFSGCLTRNDCADREVRSWHYMLSILFNFHHIKKIFIGFKTVFTKFSPQGNPQNIFKYAQNIFVFISLNMNTLRYRYDMGRRTEYDMDMNTIRHFAIRIHIWPALAISRHFQQICPSTADERCRSVRVVREKAMDISDMNSVGRVRTGYLYSLTCDCNFSRSQRAGSSERVFKLKTEDTSV